MILKSDFFVKDTVKFLLEMKSFHYLPDPRKFSLPGFPFYVKLL